MAHERKPVGRKVTQAPPPPTEVSGRGGWCLPSPLNPPAFDYRYPTHFPESLQRAIEQARLEANRIFREKSAGETSNSQSSELLREWFWHVFLPAARVMCDLGKSGVWRLNQVKSNADDLFVKAARAARIRESELLASQEWIDYERLLSLVCAGACPEPAEGVLPKGNATGMNRPARQEIEKFANDALAVARNRILADSEEKLNRILGQVKLTGNSGGYLPAHVRWGEEEVREMILAWADAHVEAFSLHGVPADKQAERDLRTAAQQIAAGSISGIRGQLQLRSVRLRIAEEGQGIPWHLEIERAMHAALAEGKLRLQRQRIKSRQVDGGSTPQPVHAPRQYDAGFWRFLRDEFDVLAARQRSMLVHDTHPKWLKAFCDFSKEHGEFGRCRHQGGLDGRLISDFEEVATRGASALGCPPDMQPVKFWIYRLGQDLLNSPEPTVRKELGPVNAGPHGMEWGWIQGLLESCGGYCSRLAAKAEREAIGGLGDKSQSQPRQKDDEKPGGPREPDLVKPLARMLPVIKVPTRPRLGARLKRLKAESNLPWRTIAKESGISYRWLLEISSGRTPSTGTRTIIRDYFSRVLKRPIHF